MIILQNISYQHPNKDRLFENLNLSIQNQNKAAIIGNNGVGKSTLLKIIAGQLHQTSGQLTIQAVPYFIPQHFGQFDQLSIAQALRIEDKLLAFKEILAGNVTEEHLNTLNDDWTIEERCETALNLWQLNGLDPDQKLDSLSGGQKTKVFLAGISIHQPELILMDEPTNHLDTEGRKLLYDFVQNSTSTLLIVSHDRKLLNLTDTICELSKTGIRVYGGTYDFYTEQKEIEQQALLNELRNTEKSLKKAKEKERETLERQNKLDSRGKQKQDKAGVARIMMNTLKNNAEKSTAKVKNMHSDKIEGISGDLQQVRSKLPEFDQIQFGFANASLHKGKILFKAKDLNLNYGNSTLWKRSLNIQINSGERISIQGPNGSGKTSLLKLILGKFHVENAQIQRIDASAVYIDQDYSLIDNSKTVYEQAQAFNNTALLEHEIKIRLNRFLFHKETWDKSCRNLSGGERMRLLLCCLTISSKSPDMLILDEPTNNLDIQNIEILTAAINQYHGTILVVSHDEIFLDQIQIDRAINL
ncbi:MAG: family ATP-binding cassette protein [Fluviicola sp.]|jgi:ATPase subunit of ABC transporter with duplicated ATPase domains|uniref:ribosomal protection-like ABC-F family protein n=1 Tax=Fluviicola sp. TaxID=1917219 RepID=UPI002602B8D8|nr:ABC-F family ATP-binding cassette domain-containing protein [Fluviicola sp.]MDF3026709.1 family ATP-binding cassette protein [Fluviicola sp.]